MSIVGFKGLKELNKVAAPFSVAIHLEADEPDLVTVYLRVRVDPSSHSLSRVFQCDIETQSYVNDGDLINAVRRMRADALRMLEEKGVDVEAQHDTRFKVLSSLPPTWRLACSGRTTPTHPTHKAHPMSNGMNLDEFLGHTSTTRGGSKFLNWRKREPAQIDSWLHTKSSIIALWRHPWPRIVEIERDGEKCVEVWGGTFNCWEPEDVLKRQYKRNDDGSRQAPPTVCPHCLLLEYLRGMVRAEKLSWTEPVFRFEGSDASSAVQLTVGGLYNAFGGDRLTRQELAEMRQAGIRRDEAWKENTMAKCAYVFSIVDDSEPEKGTQIAIETTALGDAVKRVIRDQIDALGAAEGHPLKNPYAIRWQYKPKEVEFSKKYHALAMPRLALSDEIRDLISDTEPPDLGPIVERGNVASLRAVMEARCLIDLPFDRLFEAAEKQEQRAPDQAPTAPRPAAARPVAPPKAPEPATPPPARRAAKPAAPAGPVEPTRPPGTVTLPCDACGATMGETEDTCWKCGAKYELDAPAAAPPAKPMREPGDDSDEDIGF